MARAFCPECGTDVPVDETTGLCHVGHRVELASAPGDDVGSEPAPWVASVDDQDAGAGAGPDDPVTGFGSAGSQAAADADRADDGAAPWSAPVADDDEGESLEQLAAMAAAGGGGDAAQDPVQDDDLTRDLEADLGAPDRDLDDFDLGSLEQAVAELGGDEPAPPQADLTPEAPGPDAAPDPAQAVAEIPQVPDDRPVDDVFDEHADDATAAPGGEPVNIRPDHEPEPEPSQPLDPRNFTAGGKRPSEARSSSSGGSLVDKLKGLFSR